MKFVQQGAVHYSITNKWSVYCSVYCKKRQSICFVTWDHFFPQRGVLADMKNLYNTWRPLGPVSLPVLVAQQKGYSIISLNCSQNVDLRNNQLTITFRGTDHLQHHLSGPTGVQPRLLIQDLLLFHLFLLRSNTHTHAEQSLSTYILLYLS